MAENKATPTIEKISGEVGHLGLNYQDGKIFEEARVDLRFPRSIQTYDEMSQNVVVATALAATNILASRTPFYLEAYDDTDRHKKRKEFVEECFKDMTHSFTDFIREAMSAHKYGFSIHEKVFRFRRKGDGSKYDDGLIGIKRLPVRSQSSILGWHFDDDLRDLQGVYQKPLDPLSLNIYTRRILNGQNTRSLDLDSPYPDAIYIPREKFLHIKVDSATSNPEGKSPLASCYSAWRKVQTLLEAEEIAAFKNLNGIPVLKIPSIYMSTDADEDQKKVYRTFKDGVTKLGIGEQQSIVIPSDRDDNSSPYFDFDLKSSSSSNITAITNILKTRYDQIYQCLFADIMILSTGTSGAVKTKASMLNMMVQARLIEICDQINNDLIPDLFRRNGWDDSKTPKLLFGEIADIDMEIYGKAMQQLKATKLIPVTPENINFISEVFKLPYRVPANATKAELDEILGTNDDDQSRSGDGMSTGTGNGTSKSVATRDNSANNLSNT